MNWAQRRVVDVATFDLVETLVETPVDHQHFARLVFGQGNRFVEQVLVGYGLAAAHAGVRRDDQLRCRIVDTRGQRPGSKTTEDHRVDGADACAGEHGEHRLGDHRHVDQDAVALADAEALHDRRHAHDFLLEFGEGINHFLVGLGRDEHQRAVIRALGGVTVDRVVAKIGFAADEPLGERRVRKIEYLGERLVPVDAVWLLHPRRRPDFRLISCETLGLSS
jgi:hypothetical protein